MTVVIVQAAPKARRAIGYSSYNPGPTRATLSWRKVNKYKNEHENKYKYVWHVSVSEVNKFVSHFGPYFVDPIAEVGTVGQTSSWLHLTC